MAHEDFSRAQEIEGSSNRSFGVVFAIVFSVIGLWPLLASQAPRWWWLGAALAVLAVALLRPVLLAAPNRWWMKLGLLLGAIVGPVVTAILFYLVFTPFGLVMRIFRKDPLRLKRDPAAASYWIERDPPGPDPQRMKNQF